MATLTLTMLWINSWPDGAVVLANPSADRDVSYQMAGDVVTMAGGRQRFVGQVGEQGALTVTLRLISLANVETLRAYIGRTVQVRDHRGQRWVGVYTQVAQREHKEGGWYDATLNLRTVTVPDEV